MFETKGRKHLELQNIDPYEIESFLPELEKSLQFTFDNDELTKIFTFGDLCDYIVNKLEEKSTNDCTSQQVYYRIRKAVIEAQLCDEHTFSANTSLEEIFPRKHRYQLIRKFESHLGFKVQLLHPRRWLQLLSRLALLVSIVTLCCAFLPGIVGVAISIIGLLFSKLPGKKLTVTTVRQLAKKMAKENFNDVRRHPSVVNEEEITRKIKSLFKEQFKDLDISSITRDTPLT